MNIEDIRNNIWIKVVLFLFTMIFFMICGLILLNFYFTAGQNPVFFLLEIPLLLLMLNVLRKIAT